MVKMRAAIVVCARTWNLLQLAFSVRTPRTSAAKRGSARTQSVPPSSDGCHGPGTVPLQTPCRSMLSSLPHDAGRRRRPRGGCCCCCCCCCCCTTRSAFCRGHLQAVWRCRGLGNLQMIIDASPRCTLSATLLMMIVTKTAAQSSAGAHVPTSETFVR